MKDINRTKSIILDDAKFVSNFIAELPENITHNELMGLAVNVMVSDCSRVKNEIWEKRADSINVDLALNGTLSSSERTLAKAAISLWTYGAASIDLWTLLNKLDYKNMRNTLRAIAIVHYWDAAARLEGDEFAKRMRDSFKDSD